VGKAMLTPTGEGGGYVHRTPKDPLGRFAERGTVVLDSSTVRCVVNSPEPMH
jgi:hypothetical protein